MSQLLAAALLDMRWHRLSTSALPEEVDAFEQLVLRETSIDGGHRAIAAAFLPYLRRRLCGRRSRLSVDQMLADDGYQWFVDGAVDRQTVSVPWRLLSRGNSTDLAEPYRQWRGHDPQIEPMLKNRGLMRSATLV